MTGSSTIDARAFRAALGEFVTGVTIITTADATGAPTGFTANSFNSVSLDPPMVLFSLALDSTSIDAFRQASWWAVHVLSADQEQLSIQFARRDADKFAGIPYTTGPGGVPLLDGFAARFLCRSAFEYEGGDHAIFLGEVQQFDQAGRTPLVYHKGRYGGVFPAAQRPESEPTASIESLAEHGLVAFAGQIPKLTPRGQSVAAGLAAMADSNPAFTRHERQALKHLLSKLES